MLTISPPSRRALAAVEILRGAADSLIPTVDSLTSALPDGVAFTAHATASLRAFLERRGLAGYRIFFTSLADLFDIDDHLPSLGDDLRWEPSPCGVPGGEPIELLKSEQAGSALRASGFLYIPRHQVVVARWSWVDPMQNYLRDVWLYAAEGPEPFLRLRKELLRLRHLGNRPTWQIVNNGSGDLESIPREGVKDDDLFLSPALRQRTEDEAVRFFSDEAAALYRSLGVPYRRGMLLYGPPGNGKTSLIRRIGSKLPRVSCTILRPGTNFGADDLTDVIKQWISDAPALLVIEDLNWLLKAVDLSTFLNLLDGVDTKVRGGLLIIATTNHPDQLDPAVNNRPGRFDVVVEIPPPDRELRLRYFRAKVLGFDDQVVEDLTKNTEDLSFAHLQEILRMSGLLAINAGRQTRSADDLREAARMVRYAADDASRGFPRMPEAPFGLTPKRK